MLLKTFAVLSLPLSFVVFLNLGSPLWVLPLLYVLCFLLFLLLAVIFLALVCAPVDIQKPQHEDSRFYRFIMYLYIELLIQVVGLKIETKGLERIPTGRRFVLVCNHQSEADPGIIHHFFRKSQLAFISKKENANMPFVGKIMHKTLCQMVNRQNDREALKTILKCIEIIKEDKASIAVFPEGGIKGGNVLHPFRHGVFKIAQRTRVPIVVCTLWGTQNVFHNGLRLKPTDVDFHVLGVVQPEQIQGKTAVEVGQLVHSMMAKDLGPDRVLSVEENP